MSELAREREDSGGYITRGRAGELQRRMDDLEAFVEHRLGELERRVDIALELELELVRRRAAAELAVYRAYSVAARRPQGGDLGN